MKQAVGRIFLAILALAIGMGVYAADKKARADNLSRGDREFVEKALEDAATEVELGKLAQQKGQSEAVKQFGQRLVTDHGKAGDELKGIIAKVGYTPKKDGPNPKAIKALSNKSAGRFDHEFAEFMVGDHEKAVKLFRKHSEKGDNAALKQFAGKTLPTLEDHLKMARDLKSRKKK